jgi:phytoene desaturase
MNKKVCIIGAGIGGLALALRLAKLNLHVDLYEQNESIGGKVNQIKENGFRFDTGASLITMPFVLDQLFSDAHESIDDYLEFKPLDIICRYFFADGTIINAFSDINKFAEEIELKTEDSRKSVFDYLKYCKKIYDLSGELFLSKSLSEPSAFFNVRALRTVTQIKKLDINRSMHNANNSYFRDAKTLQIFDRYATYNGSSPFKAPATLNIIQHVEYNLGAYVCTKGVYEIPKAIAALAVKNRANIYSKQKVEKIIVKNRTIYGALVDGKQKEYDIIISNADVNYTYKNLLDDSYSKMAKRYARLEKSSSAIVFYWGVNNKFQQLETHNILFSENYKEEFENLFEKKTLSNDPTIYIYISAKFNESDAPKNFENWFVLVNVPPDNNDDWNKIVAETRGIIKKKISSFLNVAIDKHIIFERFTNPKIIEEQTSSSNGSIYGISSNNRMSAFLRQQNRSKYYKGLFFCGGSAHPGGGIPLVALSAKITADLIQKYSM